jgi:putative addiction module killer protein
MGMIELRGYIDDHGHKRFAEWLDGLDAIAAAKVTIALSRMEQGNFSKVKGVGSGVFEYKIDFGPGYRLYFGKDGVRIVILIAGGTKKRQQQDIATAQECWADYKRRKKQEVHEWH